MNQLNSKYCVCFKLSSISKKTTEKLSYKVLNIYLSGAIKKVCCADSEEKGNNCIGKLLNIKLPLEQYGNIFENRTLKYVYYFVFLWYMQHLKTKISGKILIKLRQTVSPLHKFSTNLRALFTSLCIHM